MATQRESVQINLKINGIEDFKTLKDLNGQVIAQRKSVERMDKTDLGYGPAVERLNDMITLQREWRTEIYATTNAAKKQSDAVKDGWDEIQNTAAGVTLGNVVSAGIEKAMSAIDEFIGGAEAAYTEAEQNQAQLGAALKSTGEAAGRSQDQLNDMAGSLMALTGVDDDLITKSESLLLTFTGISGEIYDAALPAILDLSRALGSDLEGATIQVGKALNSPIQGMAALKKVGISFTEDQKKLVKSLQDTGDMAGAQRIILAELTKEFGGVAEAVANTESGGLQRFETRMGNIQEVVGAFLVSMKAATVQGLDPFLTKVERWISTPLEQKIQKEQSELNGLVSALVITNDNQEVRNRLIAELQAKYPDFLGKINAETASNELLTRRLEEVNDQYRQRIFIASNETKISLIQEKRNEAIREEVSAREAVAKASGLSATALAKLTDEQIRDLAVQQRKQALLADQNRSGGNAYSSGTSNTGNIEARNLDLILNGRKRIAASFKEEADLMGANAIMQQKVKDERIKSIDAEILKLKQLKTENAKAEIDRLAIEKAKLQGTWKPAATVITPVVDKKAVAEADKAKKEAVAQDEKLNEEFKRIGIDRLNDQLSANEKEVELGKQKYQKLIEDEQAFMLLKGATATQIKVHQDQITALETQRDQAAAATRVRIESEMNAAIAALRANLTNSHSTELEKETSNINKFYDDQEKKNAGNEEVIARLKTERATDLTDAELREKQRLIDESKKMEVLSNGDEDSSYAGKLAKINSHYDAELEALREKFKGQIELTQEYQDAINKIEGNREVEKENLDKDKKAKDKDAAIQGAEALNGALSSLGANNRRAEADRNMKLLDDQREKELSNKSLTEAQKQAINDKYDAKVRAEKLRAWKADQSAAAKQALISGLLGAAKAMPNIPLAAIALGTGIANALIIRKEAPPIFKKGAMVPTGPSHAQGGIDLINNATGEQIGEMEGGEPLLVLSKDTYGNNRSLINELLYNSQYRNGARVSVNTDLASQAMKYRVGGIIQQTLSGSESTQPQAILPLVNSNAGIESKLDALLSAWREGVPFNYRTNVEFDDKINAIKSRVNG